jgi:hypothetical protein
MLAIIDIKLPSTEACDFFDPEQQHNGILHDPEPGPFRHNLFRHALIPAAPHGIIPTRSCPYSNQGFFR